MHVVINAVSGARHPSGICRHAANLTRCLAARDEVSKISLMVGEWQEAYFRSAFELQHPKLQSVRIGISPRSFARNIWYLFGLPEMIEKLRGDVLQLSFPVPILRSRISVPVVSTLHDLYPYDASENFGFPNVLANRLFLRQCLLASDRVACVSEFTLSRLISVVGGGVGRKAKRIYNSVELPEACSRPPALHGLGDRPFLLCVAQHRRNKNLELLIRAFAQMRAGGMVSPETALLVVGRSGPETATIIRRIAEFNLQPRVLLVQGISDPQLVWLYRRCELLLAPSEVEGFGLPVVEALQCGARVVCSDIPAFREVGSSNCSYFDLKAADPVAAFLSACLMALRKPRSAEIRFPQFSLAASASAHISMYADLLQKHPSHLVAGVRTHVSPQSASVDGASVAS